MAYKIKVKKGRFSIGNNAYNEGQNFLMGESDYNRSNIRRIFAEGILEVVGETIYEALPQSIEINNIKEPVKEIITEKLSDKYNLNLKNKDQLEQFALEQFGIDLDKRRTLFDLKSQVEELIKAKESMNNDRNNL